MHVIRNPLDKCPQTHFPYLPRTVEFCRLCLVLIASAKFCPASRVLLVLPSPDCLCQVMIDFLCSQLTLSRIQVLVRMPTHTNLHLSLKTRVVTSVHFARLTNPVYQVQLQKNLMYLAAIADAQPQTPTMPAQMAPHPAMQPAGFYMQHPQAAAMAQQPGIFPHKMPLQFNNPHQLQEHLQQQQMYQHHQQAIQGQMGMRPGGTNNGMQPQHNEAALGGGSSGVAAPSAGQGDVRGGLKQDASGAGTDGQGSSGAGSGGGDGAEDAK
ncbi:GRF1-interacting factor 3 [Actinidia rufa]|uniref:GRF1-interacting factor 3 n=1 Tax=Actinidia rufa TaxID=165716 RepID=A0A7J0E4Z3_9ERIC|nr:GRF1-interacting factor 3 [Actinidia rufa]